MSRKYLVPALLVVQVVVFLLLASVFVSQPAAGASGAAAPLDKPQEQIAVNGLYLWSYAAKFVCGQQVPLNPGVTGEPVVKPGNYATDINIHNPGYRPTLLRKKFLILFENGQAIAAEPLSVRPRRIITMTLGADMATMDDCNTLWKYIYPNGVPGNGRPLTVGYLVILSPVDLDVDAVYTAGAPGDVFTPQQSLSIDVERVTGKRIFVPAGTLP